MRTCYLCNQSVEESEMVSSLHRNCFCNWFEVTQPEDFHDLIARSSEEGNGEREWAQINTSFFHGKFRKYSGRIGVQSYILKVV